jgi:LuxR family maltose regulon positive regulatory protein
MDILSGQPDRLAAAEETLAGCRAFDLPRNRKNQLLQIGSLQALLHKTGGDHDLALDTLRETVLLGQSGGALRYFVDTGPGLVPLLRELHNQGIATAYVGRILAAFDETVVSKPSVPDGQEKAAVSLSPAASDLMGELTNREMEVLLLLAERLTNKEIAQRLTITPRTVKKYTLNLYRKMGVNSRRQAVVRARDLGIL